MSEFESSVENLAQSIESLPEYQRFQEAEEDYMDDKEAQQLLQEIRTKENKIQIAKEKDEDKEDVQELIDEYDELYLELQELDVVEEYNQATQELEEILNDVNSQLSDLLGLNFAEIVARSE